MVWKWPFWTNFTWRIPRQHYFYLDAQHTCKPQDLTKLLGCYTKQHQRRLHLLFIHNYSTNTFYTVAKKLSERRKHCAHAGCSKVRTLPARPLSQTHRQDWLHYTVPQLASAQCNNWVCSHIYCPDYDTISWNCSEFQNLPANTNWLDSINCENHL